MRISDWSSDVCSSDLAREIRALARFLPNIKLTILSGGIAKRPQLASLEHDPHIVVGMAGRVLEHLDAATLKLADLKVLVLDEADRMLGADFEMESRAIVAPAPSSEERRVGEECVRTCRSRRGADQSQNKRSENKRAEVE